MVIDIYGYLSKIIQYNLPYIGIATELIVVVVLLQVLDLTCFIVLILYYLIFNKFYLNSMYFLIYVNSWETQVPLKCNNEKHEGCRIYTSNRST